MSDSLRPPRTVARQAPLCMGVSRQECCSGLPFPPLGVFPTQWCNLRLLHWQADLFLTTVSHGETQTLNTSQQYLPPFHSFYKEREGGQTDSGKVHTIVWLPCFLESPGKCGCLPSPVDTHVFICCHEVDYKANYTQVTYTI